MDPIGDVAGYVVHGSDEAVLDEAELSAAQAFDEALETDEQMTELLRDPKAFERYVRVHACLCVVMWLLGGVHIARVGLEFVP